MRYAAMALASVSSVSTLNSGVSVIAGAIEFTAIFSRIAARQILGQRVHRRFARAVMRRVEHIETVGPLDEILMILRTPSPPRISGIAAWQQWKQVEIDRHLAVEFLGRDVRKVRHETGAGIVHQHIDPTLLCGDPVKDGFYCAGIR